MSIVLTSVTLANNSATVTVNSPSIDLVDVQKGWVIFIDGAAGGLPLEISNGGQDVLTLAAAYTGTTLTARIAVIIETKAAIASTLESLNALGASLTSTKDANQAIVDALGTAANATLTTSTTDSTTGRVLRVGDFGHGDETAPAITDFSLQLAAGSYRALLSTATGGPDSIAYNVSVTVENAVGGAGQTFIAKRVSNSATAGEIWYGHRNAATGPVTWQTLYHSTNSVNPLDYGVGVSASSNAPNMTNFDTNKVSGLYRTVGGETGTPLSSSIASVINLKAGSADHVTQLYARGNTTNDTFDLYGRGAKDSEWGTWREFYHSGNSNLDDFNTVANGRLIGTGWATSTTSARIFLPINSRVVPTGFTSSGTFRVRTPSGADITTGITSGSLAMNSLSSPKWLIMDITTSGLTAGDPITLNAEGTSTASVKPTY